MKKVLITGAAGRIGRSLHVGLTGRYRLRLMYHRTVLPVRANEEAVVADLGDLEGVRRAVEGVEAIVHLAGNPSTQASFEEVLLANIVGAYHVYEAARLAGVPRVVFASTNHVTGMYERSGSLVWPELPVRPDSFYGASKAYGEALGRYYHDQYGLAVICLRIGSALPRPTNRRALGTWISERDMTQLIWRSIEAPVTFGVFYGISDNTRRQWDITNARDLLGYRPEDNGEVFAQEIEAKP
ncbi:MAG: NAD-dependent epimerase/dehydratase family protein [Chloroflexota bacterium]